MCVVTALLDNEKWRVAVITGTKCDVQKEVYDKEKTARAAAQAFAELNKFPFILRGGQFLSFLSNRNKEFNAEFFHAVLISLPLKVGEIIKPDRLGTLTRWNCGVVTALTQKQADDEMFDLAKERNIPYVPNFFADAPVKSEEKS
jgi:hypothetical protein